MLVTFRKHLPSFVLGVVFLFLCGKYFFTFLKFPEVPLGYDAGIYRFLFIREAEGLPPFLTPELPEWARVHAPGLFFFTSIFLKLGVSPDLLVGGAWNVMPILLAIVFALVIGRRDGKTAGIIVFLLGALSVAQYEGFLLMYQKVFFALLFCIPALLLLERHSFLTIPFGMLAIATHQQIGLLFVGAMAAALLTDAVRREFRGRQLLLFVASTILGALWYLPTYERSVGDFLPRIFESSASITGIVLSLLLAGALIVLFRREERGFRFFGWILLGLLFAAALLVLPYALFAPESPLSFLWHRADTASGVFLTFREYVVSSWPLLLLGLTGFVLSLEKERGTVFQWAALLSGVAAFGGFFFYRRFLLPFDVFMLPFAALTLKTLLFRDGKASKIAALFLIASQTFLTVRFVLAADPKLDPAVLRSFAALEASVPNGSTVIVLDNMTPWVLGYLPHASVSGPGIFDSKPYEEWEKFLFGSAAERRKFIEQYPRGTFFYATPVFRSYYPKEVLSLLRHTCLLPTATDGLFRSDCGRVPRPKT